VGTLWVHSWNHSYSDTILVKEKYLQSPWPPEGRPDYLLPWKRYSILLLVFIFLPYLSNLLYLFWDRVRLALNWLSSCLSLPRAGISGTCHHTQPNLISGDTKCIPCQAVLFFQWLTHYTLNYFKLLLILPFLSLWSPQLSTFNISLSIVGECLGLAFSLQTSNSMIVTVLSIVTQFRMSGGKYS
jgi:hypothetical protein